jgi:hypothetical protein
VLGAAFGWIFGADIMTAFAVFSQGDPSAFRITDDIILDDPPFAPVGADQSYLLGRRRGPLRRGLAHVEAVYGNIVSAGLIRVKAAFSYIDLHQFFVGIIVMEIGIYVGVYFVTFAIPGVC